MASNKKISKSKRGRRNARKLAKRHKAMQTRHRKERESGSAAA